MSCKNCIHKDVCYRIEHYGRDLESEEPCEEFVSKMIYLNYIDEAIHKFNDIIVKSNVEFSEVTNDETDYIDLFNIDFAKAIMRNINVSDVKVLAKILLAESTKNDNINEVN